MYTLDKSLSSRNSLITKLIVLLFFFFQGCATATTICGTVTTGKLIMFHSPWAVVPAIYTIGTMNKEKNVGDVILECGGTASVLWK